MERTTTALQPTVPTLPPVPYQRNQPPGTVVLCCLRTLVGIFLRRLTEDDQYARVKVEGEDLMFDISNIYTKGNRPHAERNLFIRQKIDLKTEKSCLMDRVYGFRIPSAWFPASSKISGIESSWSQGHVVLPNGSWGWTTMLDITAERQGLRRIELGFDFNFNPVCILEDSSLDEKMVRSNQVDNFDWSSTCPDDFNWHEIHEGSRGYRKADHEGIWNLRGHRLYGLDICLSKSPGHNGSIVVLERDEKLVPLAWEVSIDDLAGPFTN
jgi:hypothetical protein